jgi:ATP-binding cassette subfamily A (ABC1) protein 3
MIVVKKSREDNVKLEDFITKNIPDSKKVSEVSSEATYHLPKSSASHFGSFFKKFDQELESLGVGSYGVSMTTLEEVFLQVESGDSKKDAKNLENIKKRLTSEAENKKEETEYSIAKEQVSGTCNVFWLHFSALFIKRFLLSKRNFKGFLIDLFIPGMLVVAGFGLSTIDFFKDSGERLLDVSLFPEKQRCIYNTNGITGGGDPATLIGLLDSASYFDCTGVTSTTGSNKETLQNFDDILYDEAQEEEMKPYRYGSYYFETLNYGTDQYKVVSFTNTTSQEAIVAFPQFMYESILKRVAGSSFNYKMVNDPMPITQIYKDRNKGGGGMFLGFVLGIAFALIPTSVIGFILNESANSLVHQQVISGMNKISYWTANYCFDVAKTFVTMFISIIALYVFNLEIEFAWLLLLLFPTAIIAYTYAIAQFFKEESTGQNFTIMHNFFIGGLLPIVITILRIIKTTRDLGDFLMWPFRIFPIFNMCGGFVFISVKGAIATVKGKKEPESLSGEVAGADVAMLVLHPFIWITLLALFELNCFRC